jgi:hypothetical protein
MGHATNPRRLNTPENLRLRHSVHVDSVGFIWSWLFWRGRRTRVREGVSVEVSKNVSMRRGNKAFSENNAAIVALDDVLFCVTVSTRDTEFVGLAVERVPASELWALRTPGKFMVQRWDASCCATVVTLCEWQQPSI